MDWMTESIFLNLKANSDKEIANKVGQALWDFYMYQIHILKKVHADPHPELLSER
jgi:predicted unusual protein kinase regulating ubiquinone biosynthesis (AarF/ABC1/UbiB family)